MQILCQKMNEKFLIKNNYLHHRAINEACHIGKDIVIIAVSGCKGRMKRIMK